jgi:hypothetical protein
MNDRAKWSAVLTAILLAAAAVPGTGETGSRNKPKEPPLRTFFIEEAGIELTLTDNWFPQTALPDRKVARMLTSLKDLSQIRIALIPFQAEINEANFQERLGEFIGSVKKSQPDFELASSVLVPGDPARLHVEGSWTVEKRCVQVLMEVFPAKARTVLVTLTTQKASGNKFRILADLLKTRLVVKEKPIPAPAPPVLETTQGEVHVRIEPPRGWRPALKEEMDFLAKQMAGEGLYEESSSLSGQVGIVYPTMELISPTLTFRSSKGAVPVSGENRPKFEALYVSAMAARGGAFKVERVAVETIGGIASFMVDGTTRRTSFSVRSRQYFIPFPEETVIVTLSTLADGGGGAAAGIEELLAGIAFKPNETGTTKAPIVPGKPPPSSRGAARTLPWAVGGLALLLILVILAFKIRAIARARKSRR